MTRRSFSRIVLVFNPISKFRLVSAGVCALIFALAVPASAQQVKKVYRMGILTNLVTTDPQVSPLWEVFRQALAERGWVEDTPL